MGAIERWDGRSGVGNLNAWASMQRAMELAKTHGIGVVALANTNHWMRGGSYGWQAGGSGDVRDLLDEYAGESAGLGGDIAFAGEQPAGVWRCLGAGGHVVLDMAMSQFSPMDRSKATASAGSSLPVDGGFDSAGNLTKDAAAIEASRCVRCRLGTGRGIGAFAGAGYDCCDARERKSDCIRFRRGVGALCRPDRQADFFSDQSEFGGERGGDELALRMGSSIFFIRRRRRWTLGNHSAVSGRADSVQLREENMRLGVPVDPEIWQRISARP